MTSEKEKKWHVSSYKKRSLRRRLNHERGSLCQACQSSKADVIHHIDENPQNNSLENLQLLCSDCHRAVHKKLRESTRKTTGPLYKRPNNPEMKH